MEIRSFSRITSVKSSFARSRVADGLNGGLHEIELKGEIRLPRSFCRILTSDNSGIVEIHISLYFFPGPYISGPLQIFDKEPQNIGKLVISPACPEDKWLPSRMPSAQMNINLPIDQFLPISTMRNSLLSLDIYLSADDGKLPSIRYHDDGRETWYIDRIEFLEEIPIN